jgi:hypothetical protein
VTTTEQATRAERKTALVAGILYLITFISSIPAVFLLDPGAARPDLHRPPSQF